jgi:hypothetical protein
VNLFAQLPMDPLRDLRDIHLPPPPELWPPAPGWWALAIVATAGVGYGVVLAVGAWRRGRPRRAAVRAVADLRSRHAAGEPPGVLIGELATLVRRAAMIRHPRERVAGLTGREWLEFLDDDQHHFTRGAGASLASAPYTGREPANLDALIAVCESWVRKNA